MNIPSASRYPNTEKPRFQLLNPKIYVPKSHKPLIFIDTFFWKHLNSNHILSKKLQKACETGTVNLVLSDMILGELTIHNLRDKVGELCKENLHVTHSMHITANQIIQSLSVFMHSQRLIRLPWDLVVTEPPFVGKGLHGLGDIVGIIARELSKLRNHPEGRSEESLVSGLVDVDREVWRDILKIYGDILCKDTGSPVERYEEFFWTDFFTDLPAIVLSAYLLAYTLRGKDLRKNDVVDIFTIAELLPYASLYITDKELSGRFNRVARDYPEVFAHYQKNCQVVSGLDTSTQALEEFLNATLSRKTH